MPKQDLGGGSGQSLTVLHADHTSEAGGAELALARLLKSGPPWSPVLALPRSIEAGVFESLPVKRIGPPQQALQEHGAGRLRRLYLRVRASATLLAGSVEWACTGWVRRADVVHVNTTRMAVMLVPLAATGGPPIVLHLRDRAVASEVGLINSLVLRFFARFVAAAVIGNSRSTLESLGPRCLRRVRCDVIFSHAGVTRSTKAWSPGPASDGLRVLHLARLAPWKGQRLAIDAISILKSMNVPVTLYVAGGESFGSAGEEAALREYAQRKSVGDRVEFLGHVRDVETLIDSMDLCLQSSIRPEPLGQNVMQYMLRGAPTIVSGEGGPLELISHGISGLSYLPRSSEDLAAKINHLWNDPRYSARLASNALTASCAFDSENLLKAYEGVFRNVQG